MGLNILYDIFSVFDLYLISIIKWSIKSHNNKKISETVKYWNNLH